MQVIKRTGKREDVSFDKITARIKKLCYGLNPLVNYIEISKKVIQGLFDGVTTTELDNLAAETAASLAAQHPDYAVLAARIAVSNLHKNTDKSFSRTMKDLYNYIDPKTGDKAGLIGEETHKIIQKNKDNSTQPSFMTAIMSSIISVLRLWNALICCAWIEKSLSVRNNYSFAYRSVFMVKTLMRRLKRII